MDVSDGDEGRNDRFCGPVSPGVPKDIDDKVKHLLKQLKGDSIEQSAELLCAIAGGGIIGKRVRYECTARLSVICHSTT